jgi:ParB-like chromosome segregation protein Spo0J
MSNAAAIPDISSAREASRPAAVRIRDLTVGGGIRSRGIDQDHVRVLAEQDGEWPPIVIWGPNNQVVDGCHRVAAARLLGQARISAVRYEGSAEDAYLESVRSNVAHGLPLSLDDRREAARRVLVAHPEWSDRRTAALCSLSGKTVGRLREELARNASKGRPPAQPAPLQLREGKDGRLRPVRTEELHDRILKAIEENPSGSLRSIAAVAEASPETVRTVRARLSNEGKAAVQALRVTPLKEVGTGSWDSDKALSTCADDGQFVDWFRSTSIDGAWRRFADVVPISRVYTVADEARRRAKSWNEFAGALEARAATPQRRRA